MLLDHDMRGALWEWARDAVGRDDVGTQVEVIWSRQGAPRPALPYVTLHPTSYVKTGIDEPGQTNVDGERAIYGTRALTLGVQTFAARPLHEGSRYVTAFELADRIVRYAETQVSLATLSAACLALYDEGSIQDISALLDEVEWEERAAVDLFLRSTSEQREHVGCIEHVELVDGLSGARRIVPPSSP